MNIQLGTITTELLDHLIFYGNAKLSIQSMVDLIDLQKFHIIIHCYKQAELYDKYKHVYDFDITMLDLILQSYIQNYNYQEAPDMRVNGNEIVDDQFDTFKQTMKAMLEFQEHIKIDSPDPILELLMRDLTLFSDTEMIKDEEKVKELIDYLIKLGASREKALRIILVDDEEYLVPDEMYHRDTWKYIQYIKSYSHEGR